MKILLAIQGTGNGHLARSTELKLELNKYGAVDVLISGTHHELEIPFDVKFNYHGLGFKFGNTGNVDCWKTWNEISIKKFIQEYKHLPIHQYDLVVSDFEPISILKAKLNGIPNIGISNQNAALLAGFPMSPWPDIIGKGILKQYAKASKNLAYYYYPFHTEVFAPPIRSEIRNGKISEEKFTLVYLPAHSPENQIPIFLHNKHLYFKSFVKELTSSVYGANYEMHPIHKLHFTEAMLGCKNALVAAGFGTTCELLHIGKKMVVVPMQYQYEQHCNATGLKKLNITTLPKITTDNMDRIELLFHHANSIKMNYMNSIPVVAKRIMELYHSSEISTPSLLHNELIQHRLLNG